MTYHARPNPTTAGTTTGPRFTFSADAPPASPSAPVAPTTEPATDAANLPNAERVVERSDVDNGQRPTDADPTDRSRDRDNATPPPPLGGARAWYREEPWLAVELAAFLPTLAALFVPVQFRIPLFGLSGLLVVIGLAMLIRQGLSRAHAIPRAASGSADNTRPGREDTRY